MNDYFGVRMVRAEAMPRINDLTPQPAMSVNLAAVPQRRSQRLKLLELTLLGGARGPGPVSSADNIDGLELIHSDDASVHEDFHLLLGMLAVAHCGVAERRNASVGISECCDKI